MLCPSGFSCVFVLVLLSSPHVLFHVSIFPTLYFFFSLTFSACVGLHFRFYYYYYYAKGRLPAPFFPRTQCPSPLFVVGMCGVVFERSYGARLPIFDSCVAVVAFVSFSLLKKRIKRGCSIRFLLHFSRANALFPL